jgi:hypothetical protein
MHRVSPSHPFPSLPCSDTVKPMRGTGIAYVVVASIWSLLVMVSFLRKPQCATVFRVFIVLGVCLVFITWSFTSLALGVALVFSDGCRYPEFTALAMMDVTTPPPYPPQLATLDPTLYYYLTCDVVSFVLYGLPLMFWVGFLDRNLVGASHCASGSPLPIP